MEVACFVFRSDVLVLVCTSLKSRGYILVLWDFFFFFECENNWGRSKIAFSALAWKKFFPLFHSGYKRYLRNDYNQGEKQFLVPD